MVIMSVDYGDSRTGLAVCDKFQMLASPVGVVFEKYQPKVIAQIKETAEKYKAERFVVGLPKNMDGTEGERAQKCREFAAALTEATGIESVMMDERLTTVEAHKALNAVNVRGTKRKNIVDAVSAVMILEDYLKII